MSEFKLEIFNDTNSIFEQNILINEFRSRENNDNINNKIILKDINENIYTIDPLDLNVENNRIEENQKYIKISIAYNDDNINRNHVKKIQIDANDKFGTSKINYFELILKDNENGIYKKKYALFNVAYKRYLLFKIELYDIKFYNNYFGLPFIKAKAGFSNCNNHEEIIQKFQKYFREKRIKVSREDINQNNKIAMNIDLRDLGENVGQPLNNRVTIKLEQKKKDCIRNTVCYIGTIILFLSKFIRIIFQIGEFYFSIILFGIYLETTTLLITSSSKFLTWGWGAFILEALVLIAIFYFTNIISILPLVFQFWLASNLSYIKEKNPIKIIVRGFSIFCRKSNIDECNYICELTFDIIFFVFFLLYIISFCIYNKEPKMFEVLNLLIFIIFPLINLSVIYGFTWYKGFKVILKYFNLRCDCRCDCDKLPNDDDELKQLVYYDKF